MLKSSEKHNVNSSSDVSVGYAYDQGTSKNRMSYPRCYNVAFRARQLYLRPARPVPARVSWKRVSTAKILLICVAATKQGVLLLELEFSFCGW